MRAATHVEFAVRGPDDLDACFETTCMAVFATACHLVDGHRARAEQLMIDVFAGLRTSVCAGSQVVVDHEWIVATALRQVLGHEPATGTEALTALERAVLELHLLDGRDIDGVAATLGLTSAEIRMSLERFDEQVGPRGHPGFSADYVDELLRRSELWLDDSTRRRGRSVLRAQGGTGDRTAVARAEHHLPEAARSAHAVGAAAAAAPTAVPPAGVAATAETPRVPRRRHIVMAGSAVAAIAVGVALVLPREPSKTDVDRRVGLADSTVTTPVPMSTPVAPPPSSLEVPQAPMVASEQSTVSQQSRRVPLQAPGFVLDDIPVGLQPNGAIERRGAAPMGRFDLWAEPGATRLGGRWLAVATTSQILTRTAIVHDALRVTVAGSPGLLSVAPDGISTLIVHPASGGQFAITGNDFTVDELGRLAADVTVTGDGPVFDAASDARLAGLAPLLHSTSESGDLSSQATTGARRISRYISTDRAHYVTLSTRPAVDNDLLIGELLLGPPTADVLSPSADVLPPTAPGRVVAVGERNVSVSAAGDDEPGATLIQWHEGDETLTMRGNVDLDVMLSVIGSVRRATLSEWTALFRTDGVDPIDASPQLRGDVVRVGRTSTPDRSRWTISMDDDPLGVRFEVLNYSVVGTMGEVLFDQDDLPPLQEFVSMSSTLLLVALVPPPDATGVRITVEGSNPTTIPLVPVRDSGLVAAGFAFIEIAPYTVDIVDSAGAIVRSLTP